MRRDMQCTSCEKPLTGGLDTFADVGAELCEECFTELMEEAVIEQRQAEANRKPCPKCGALMWENGWNPGLYHCVPCKHWWDFVHNQGWTFHPAQAAADAKT